MTSQSRRYENPWMRDFLPVMYIGVIMIGQLDI